MSLIIFKCKEKYELPNEKIPMVSCVANYYDPISIGLWQRRR